MSAKRILLIEDDAFVRKGLERFLRAEQYEVTALGNANDAIGIVQAQLPDLMILDLTLVVEGAFAGITDGFSFIAWLRYSLPHAAFPIIIFTVDSSPKVDVRAAECGAYAVVRKTQAFPELLGVIRAALGEEADPKA